MDKSTTKVPLIDSRCQEIALRVKINGISVKTIQDTGSPVTVISRSIYEELASEFEDDGKRVSSALRRSKIKLFACEKHRAVAMSGECDLKIEKEEFQWVSKSNGASGLAHDCLIGMNILVRWPTMKEAISVSMKSEPRGEEGFSLSSNPDIAKLQRICLPPNLSNCEFLTNT